MAVIPHRPLAPEPPEKSPDSLQNQPVVHFSVEEREKLADPSVGFDQKVKIISENLEKNCPKPRGKGPGGGGGLSGYAAAMLGYQCAMDHFAIESRIWSEKVSKDEAFRSKLESICVAEKKKSGLGHRNAPEGRGR